MVPSKREGGGEVEVKEGGLSCWTLEIKERNTEKNVVLENEGELN